MEEFSEASAIIEMNEQFRLEEGMDSSGRRQFAPRRTPLEEVSRTWWEFCRLHNISQVVREPHWTGSRWAASARLGGYSRRFVLRWVANWQPMGFSLSTLVKATCPSGVAPLYEEQLARAYDPAAPPVQKHRITREEASYGAKVRAQRKSMREAGYRGFWED